MKYRSEFILRRKLFSIVLIGLVVSISLICIYFGSSFGPGLPSVDEQGNVVGDDGIDPVFGGFVHRQDDFDDNLFEDQERNPDVPKSIPVCIKVRFLYLCLVL